MFTFFLNFDVCMYIDIKLKINIFTTPQIILRMGWIWELILYSGTVFDVFELRYHNKDTKMLT